jgi:hypothetical protein
MSYELNSIILLLNSIKERRHSVFILAFVASFLSFSRNLVVVHNSKRNDEIPTE